MVLSEGTTEKNPQVTPPGIDPGTVRLVAQSLNHYATPTHHPVHQRIQLPLGTRVKIALASTTLITSRNTISTWKRIIKC